MPVPDRSALLEKVRRLPRRPGVYLMRDRFGTILYVGKAKELKRRVSSYFQPSRKFAVAQPKVAAMLDLVWDFDTIEVRTETEALLLEGKLIKQYQPRYNTDFTDDKRFLLVKLDESATLPRFRLTRVRNDDGARYWGPFAHSGMLRRTLAELRRRHGVLLGDSNPRRLEDGRWRLYDDARRELYGPLGGDVTVEEYRARVAEAAAFLDGHARESLESVQREMEEAAARLEFEKAARLRDLAEALRLTAAPVRRFARGRAVQEPAASPDEALGELREALTLAGEPTVIECFDISHISGTFCVASMVRFVHGRPDRAGYRRFRIQTFVGNDDFRAMHEVVGRRYARLAEEGRSFPDLVLIDGGKGQVGAACRAFRERGLEAPPIIGLAKKEELVIFPDERPPLAMPAHRPGRRLLQRVRDEAHRFANTYNAELRSRKIRESVLMDCPGLGASRREALLLHFGSLDRLAGAEIEAIAEVPGLGLKLAAEVHAFLRRVSRDAEQADLDAGDETGDPEADRLPGDGHLPTLFRPGGA